jgi:hypothetical protein
MTVKAGEFRFTQDKRKLAGKAVRDAAARAFQDAGEYLLEEANRTVPHEEGTLARSGKVTTTRAGSNGVETRILTAVSYDTPYAVRQHEDTRLRHDPGRRAKWLERTFAEQAGRVGEFIAGRIRRAVESGP